MAVAEGLPAAGLVLVSYPLHPPGQPDRLRTEHFGPPRLTLPVRLRDPGRVCYTGGTRGGGGAHTRAGELSLGRGRRPWVCGAGTAGGHGRGRLAGRKGGGTYPVINWRRLLSTGRGISVLARRHLATRVPGALGI